MLGGRGEFGECIRGFRPSGRNLVASLTARRKKVGQSGFLNMGDSRLFVRTLLSPHCGLRSFYGSSRAANKNREQGLGTGDKGTSGSSLTARRKRVEGKVGWF